MARLDTTLDRHDFDDIINGVDPMEHVVVVKVDEISKLTPRGTVLVGEPGGNLKPISEAIKATDAVYILAEDVEKASAGSEVTAYNAGNFAASRLSTDGEYELAAADLEYMREKNFNVTHIVEFADGLEAV